MGLEGLTGVEHVKSMLLNVLWSLGEVAVVGEEEALEEEAVEEETVVAVVEGEAVVVEEVEAEEEEVEEKKLSTYFLRRS